MHHFHAFALQNYAKQLLPVQDLLEASQQWSQTVGTLSENPGSKKYIMNLSYAHPD